MREPRTLKTFFTVVILGAALLMFWARNTSLESNRNVYQNGDRSVDQVIGSLEKSLGESQELDIVDWSDLVMTRDRKNFKVRCRYRIIPRTDEKVVTKNDVFICDRTSHIAFLSSSRTGTTTSLIRKRIRPPVGS